MPRRKRCNYGVQRKYKRRRYQPSQHHISNGRFLSETDVIKIEVDSGTVSESLGNEKPRNEEVHCSDNTLNVRFFCEPSYLGTVTNCDNYDSMYAFATETVPESENETEFNNSEDSHNVAIIGCDKILQNNLSSEAENVQRVTNLTDSVAINSEMESNTSAEFYRTEINQNCGVAGNNNTNKSICKPENLASLNSEPSTQLDNTVIKIETDFDDISEFSGSEGATAFGPDEAKHVDSLKGLSISCLRENLHNLPKPFILNSHSDDIEVLSVISEDEKTYINMKIIVKPTGHTSIFVHGKKVSDAHPLWDCLPELLTTKEDILSLLYVLSRLQVCTGNPDKEFTELIPIDTEIWHSDTGVIAYHENNFNAVYKSTIRSVSCELLTLKERCQYCSKYRRCLKDKRDRHNKLMASDIDFTKSTYKHSDMPREILLKKIQQQRNQIKALQTNINRLQRQIKHPVGKQPENKDQTAMKDLTELNEQKVFEFFFRI